MSALRAYLLSLFLVFGGLGVIPSAEAARYITTADNENNAGTGVPDNDMGSCIFNDDSRHPIEFNINLSGALPTKNAYLSVFINDIDWPDEVDEIFLNGHSLGFAAGLNGVNNSTLFVLPDLSWVKAGKNLVQVRVDKNNVHSWCAAVVNGQLVIDEGLGLGPASIRSLSANAAAYNFGSAVNIDLDVDTAATASQNVRLELILRDTNGAIIDFDRNSAIQSWPVTGSNNEPYRWAFTLPTSGASGLWTVTLGAYDVTTAELNATKTVSFAVPLTAASLPVVSGVTPATGSAGSAITISGQNFIQGGTTCTLGGMDVTNLVIVGGSTITGTVPALAAGLYALACSTRFGAANLPNAFTVAKNSQSMTFGAAPTVTVGGTGTLSATASSGLAVTFSSTTTGICTVSGTTVTGVAAGTCTIAAKQAGNSSYSAAPQVTQSFNVTAVAPASGDLITYIQNGDLYSTTTLGGTATRLTTSGKVIDQRISPDRSKIAYTQEISAGSSYDVRIMNADGSGAVSIGTKTQGNHIWGLGLSFSPDGASLAYSSDDGLWKVGVNGTGKTLLAASPSGRTWREVDWSANGKIAAQSIGGWGYTSEIRIMNADGSNPTIIVPDAPGALHGTRFAPDGLSIFYNYDVSGHEESSGRQIDTSIFVAGIDGSNPVNLSQASGRASGTRDYIDALSPNGTRILFTNCQDNIGCSLMVMNRDGTQRQTAIAGTASVSISVEGVDWRGATIATTVLEDNFDDGVINTTIWKTKGNTVTEHDGYADLQADVTDNVGYLSADFAPLSKLRLEFRHMMHANSSSGWYFLPDVNFGSVAENSATGDLGWFNIAWRKSQWFGNACDSAANYDRVVIGLENLGCFAISQANSSSYYDRWITSIIEYDSVTGLITVDFENDGVIDLQAILPPERRYAIKRLGFSPYGWWTGHWHRLDYVRLTSGSNTTPAIPQTIAFGTPPTVAVGGTGTVSATSTSGLPVTFSSLTTPICTVTGSTVTGIAAGICTLAANQVGNSTYAAAPQATTSFSVTANIVSPGAPTITSIKVNSGSATINFAPPGNTGGSPIASYTATCTASGQTTRTATGTASPLTVRNLAGGVAYPCSVTATNGGGLSSASSATMAVTAKQSSLTPILMLLLD